MKTKNWTVEIINRNGMECYDVEAPYEIVLNMVKKKIKKYPESSYDIRESD